MQDYERDNILEQYEIAVNSTRKTRGAILCDTDQGLLLLKEVRVSEKRIPALYELYEYLYSQGYGRIDRIILTREGECLSALEDGSRYMLKSWFKGRECDVKKPAETACGIRQPGEASYIDAHELESNVTAGAI